MSDRIVFFRDEEDCAVPSYSSVNERDIECRYSEEYALQCEEDEEMAGIVVVVVVVKVMARVIFFLGSLCNLFLLKNVWFTSPRNSTTRSILHSNRSHHQESCFGSQI